MTEPNPDGDNLTLMEVLKRLEAADFTSQFAPLEGGEVRCLSCREVHDAAGFEVTSLERTEGASDPDDMLAIVALTCPSCKAKGTLTLHYGPESPLDETETLLRLEDESVKGGWPAT